MTELVCEMYVRNIVKTPVLDSKTGVFDRKMREKLQGIERIERKIEDEIKRK